jgi:biotin-(acetyl-CoA carboxylase) ligase
VPRRRRVGCARPEARRDEKQEFPHSGNRQLAGQGRCKAWISSMPALVMALVANSKMLPHRFWAMRPPATNNINHLAFIP